VRRILVLMLSVPLLTASVAAAADDKRASLRGSAAAMREQNRVAKDSGLSFFSTAEEIRKAVDREELVKLSGNDDYEVADFVSHPYAVPAVRTFVERLSAQYHEACDQRLVVTSAVRPSSRQPANASRLSVHPAGMAVALRVSDRASCRQWLESTILSLERSGVINGIREFNPPHYHIAVYPEPYLAHVGERIEAERAREEAAEAEAMMAARAAPRPVEVVSGAAAPDVATPATVESAGRNAILPLWALPLVLVLGASVGAAWWLLSAGHATLRPFSVPSWGALSSSLPLRSQGSRLVRSVRRRAES
jgi:hypothetical protein